MISSDLTEARTGEEKFGNQGPWSGLYDVIGF